MEIDSISIKKLLDYLDKVLNSNTYKRIIATLDIKNVDDFYYNFVNIISKYYISTLDDSIIHAEEICAEYFNHKGKNEDFFNTVLYDRIISACSNQIGHVDNDIEVYYKVAELVSKRNGKNRFYTHCFPGAILDDVKENGLDVSRVRLQSEIATLNKYFKTPYRIGALYYCELSAGSISYSTNNVPESVRFSLGGVRGNNQEETIYEMCTRSFLENIEKLKSQGVDQTEIEKLKEAGKKVIDFYCTKSKAGIAFFKDREIDKKYNINFSLLDCQNEFGYNSFITKRIRQIIALMNSNPQNAFQIWEAEINKLCYNNPELRQTIDLIVKTHFANRMQQLEINNFNHEGNADGYEVPNGILPRDRFEILEVDVPRELHIESRRKNIPLMEEKPVQEEKGTSKKTITTCENIEKIVKTGEDIDSIFFLSSNDFNMNMYVSEGLLKPFNHYCYNHGNGLYISERSIFALEREVQIDMKNNYRSSGQTIDPIVEMYKQCDLYDSEYDKGEVLITSALQWYFKIQFDNLSEEVKQKMIYEKSLEHSGVLLTFENGKYFATDGSNKQMLESTILVSRETPAPYNALFNCIMESRGIGPQGMIL